MSYETAVNSSVFAFSGVFFILIMIIPLTLYILNAFALMTIATNRGSDKGWLAWVPIANTFLVPMLVDDDVEEPLKGKLTIIFGVSLALSLIPLIGILFALANGALVLYAFFTLFKQYTENYVMYLVISVLSGGIAIPFLLYRIRNRQPVVIT